MSCHVSVLCVLLVAVMSMCLTFSNVKVSEQIFPMAKKEVICRQCFFTKCQIISLENLYKNIYLALLIFWVESF